MLSRLDRILDSEKDRSKSLDNFKMLLVDFSEFPLKVKGESLEKLSTEISFSEKLGRAFKLLQKEDISNNGYCCEYLVEIYRAKLIYDQN